MEENNKIIAEFMGLNNLKDSKGDAWDYMNTGKSIYTLRTKNLHYESDWNWLMKVVEKIEKEFCSTNIHYYSQKQMYSVEFLGFNIEYDNSEYGDDKMKILYDSCVKFINFYNKQKEE